MEMEIKFPGGARVQAAMDGFVVETDQPVQGGGDGSAPTPFSLFLASIGTCAGIYVLSFCKQRNLPTEGLSLRQQVSYDHATHMVSQIDLEIVTPPGFPEQYLPALIKTAGLCAVKKHLENPPKITVTTKAG